LILSCEELGELTSYKRPSAQIKWLESQNYPFDVGGDGYPKVLASYVQRRLGGEQLINKVTKNSPRPNFKSLM
jgi:hypothetical protein